MLLYTFFDFVEKFYKFFETKEFNPENEDDRKIVQKRINLMMESPLMKKWLSQSILFGKDEQFTNEVLMYLLDCATEFHKSLVNCLSLKLGGALKNKY